MGDVRIPAVATVAAAVVAVLGSIFAVWLSGRQQRRLQVGEFKERATARRAQWTEERSRAARAAEVDACVRFDAAVAIAVARLRRSVDLAGRPGLRRRLLGKTWARQWNREITEAAIDLALPFTALRLTARPALRQEAYAVASAFEAASEALGSLPSPMPEVLLRGAVARPWRQRVEAAIANVQEARGGLAAALELTEDAS